VRSRSCEITISLRICGPKEIIFEARDRSDSQSQEPGLGAVGVTAMARPTCAGNGNGNEPPGGDKEIRRHRLREDLRRATRETGAFLERSGAEMKTAIFFSEREWNWTKGRRRGSFSGRGNDQTNITRRQNI